MIVFGLLVLSVLSGMVGLGVAFAAVPFLSLFLPDLVRQVQPLSLLLNGGYGLYGDFGIRQGRLRGLEEGRSIGHRRDGMRTFGFIPRHAHFPTVCLVSVFSRGCISG